MAYVFHVFNVLDEVLMNSLAYRLGERLCVFISCLVFVYFNFDVVNLDFYNNLDIHNYYADFVNKSWTYDIGFELYQSIIRDYFGFGFHFFWIITLGGICFFWLNLNKKILQIPFFIIAFYFCGEIVGTQIRYYLSIILLIYFIFNLSSGYYKTLLLSSLCFIHYGAVFFLLCHFLACYLCKVNMFYFLHRHRKKIYLFSLFFYFVSFSLVVTLLPYTRFAYYLDSFYLESKSIISLIYATIMLVFLLEVIFPKIQYCLNEFKIIIATYAITLIFVISFSSIAVLSGRVLITSIIFEVIIAYVLLELKEIKTYVSYLMLSSIKIFPIFYIYLKGLI